MITITRVQNGHLPALQDILSHFPEFTRAPFSLEMLMEQPDMLLLQAASEEAIPLGLLTALILPDEMELHSFAVHPKAQGLGIGQALIKGFIEEGRRLSLKSLWLEVRPSNTIALHIYRKHGFVCKHERKDYYQSPRENAWVMHLDLKTSGDASPQESK